MEGRKKEIFKTGLVKAAKSTNALILTGGNNIGAMKLVGDAVREGQFFVQVSQKTAAFFGLFKAFLFYVGRE